MPPFVPCYVFQSELGAYGLPSTSQQSDIMSIVQYCSLLIDEACGRVDGDGNGSLVYTTYTQRVLLQTKNRNLCYLSMKPITPVTPAYVSQLASQAVSGWSPNFNNFFTGVQGSTVNGPFGTLTGIIGASGRYGYSRQDMSIAYPDLFAFINPLNLVTMFGGPAPWVSIDITQTDYDPKTGEVWVPAGLQLQKYSEIYISYTCGYDPNNMPFQIKYATASVVKNYLGKGAGTTGLKTLSMGRTSVNITMADLLVDPQLDQLLTPFKSIQAH